MTHITILALASYVTPMCSLYRPKGLVSVNCDEQEETYHDRGPPPKHKRQKRDAEREDRNGVSLSVRARSCSYGQDVRGALGDIEYEGKEGKEGGGPKDERGSRGRRVRREQYILALSVAVSAWLNLCRLNMSQEQPISIPMANLQVVVKLFVLGLLLLAVSLAGFVASQSSCRYNDCTFETHAAFSVGVAALTAGEVASAVTQLL
ncbi:hypothetical protein C7M84_024138 [Penaeus vannamei]|uniref:Uncharacterized protein n=1 Tax=Penaeus vannamei TaxID=6689 RepID=A0A3R7NBJ9_PENVA|nr:hypothetical protein C7M84_024138 [Penaeus vannamei]